MTLIHVTGSDGSAYVYDRQTGSLRVSSGEDDMGISDVLASPTREQWRVRTAKSDTTLKVPPGLTDEQLADAIGAHAEVADAAGLQPPPALSIGVRPKP